MISRNSRLSVIMYHYVRDLRASSFPKIKGLDIDLFKNQILYLKNNYNFISVEDLLTAYRSPVELPSKSVLLTFDDGFMDHYKFVFPVLQKEKIEGLFFPPAKPILEGKTLDVHKIQFILASNINIKTLFNELLNILHDLEKEYNLKSKRFYFEKYLVQSKYDDEKTNFIKSMLQYVLPEKLREIICKEFFHKYVTNDELSFSKELYLDLKNISEMIEGGMFFGSHGTEHKWLSKLKKHEQEQDIKTSIEFLKTAGHSLKNLTMCFPYGDFNKDTLTILKKYDFCLGFGIETRVANISKDNILTLPRLDTNDIPMFMDQPNRWYEEA